MTGSTPSPTARTGDAEIEHQLRQLFAHQGTALDRHPRPQPHPYPADPGPVLLAIDGGPTPGRSNSRPARRLILSAAAALAIAAGGVMALAQRPHRAETAAQGLVLAGETVLSADPLVVQAGRGPEPRFDTGDLGTKVQLEPVGSLVETGVEGALSNGSSLAATPMFGAPPTAATVVKTTVVGRVNGVPWVLVFADAPVTPKPDGATIDRVRILASPDSAQTTISELTNPDSLAVIQPSPGDSGPRVAPQFLPDQGGTLVWDRLPPDTAVVSYADTDGDRRWTRPVAGLGVLPVDLTPGERYIVTALAADGRELDRTTGTAPKEVQPLQPGDRLTVEAVTVTQDGTDGAPVTFGATGRPTVLMVGADWCGPCQEGRADTAATLAALGPEVDVYSVAVEGGTTIWPPIPTDPADQPDAWPFPRLRLVDPTAPDGAAPSQFDGLALPAVIVLDRKGTVIDVIVGLDRRLADHLADLGLPPTGS